MDSTTSTPATNGADRRKSGRTINRPSLFADEHHEGSILASAKRKRASGNDPNDEMDVDEEPTEFVDENNDSDEDEEDEEDEEADEEDRRGTRRAQKSKNAVTKPATKRAKTSKGAATTLAIRPANLPSKAATKASKQKARSRPSQFHAQGLYAEVFGKGRDAESAAGYWLKELQKDNVAGIKDLVNLMLQVVGCDSRIEAADIEDIDNVPTKLGDILEEYAQQKQSDYPLSGKQRQNAGMRDVLAEFFKATIHALHNSGLLYEEPAIYDNMHVWSATMAGAGYRSFRHTATVVSLSMSTALTEIAKEVQASISQSKSQIEAEKKKKSNNKARITKLQSEMAKEEEKLAFIDNQLQDAFNTVYVHRYRDVDEKNRVECVAALGGWIMNYRKMFLEGSYLRYLGWILSDPNAPTRLEVIRQLKALFKQKQNVAALRSFTDRFRSRIVEMGTRDTDVNVRAETIELLDRLRNAELLEPDDIDTIGQLIFDNEPRVRKAVAKFFVSNIEDLYSASIEDIDREQLDEYLPNGADVDEFDQPSKAWIRFKCLSQTLGTHHKEKKETVKHDFVYGVEEIDSRFMLATQSIYPFMPDLQEWQNLAGYLLYDHSGIPDAMDGDTESMIQATYKLESGEDVILLDVLYYAVKLSLQQMAESIQSAKTKKAKDTAKVILDTAAHNLTVMIPQLLSKFGSSPEAATSILRLEQLLGSDLIEVVETTEGEGTYAGLLDDIKKQFTSHNDPHVQAEAIRALRAALSAEATHELAETKVTEMWTEASRKLASLLNGKNISTRGTLDQKVLSQVVDLVSRLARLGGVSNCTENLEDRVPWPKSKVNRKDTLLDLLHQLLPRGVADDETAEQFVEFENQLATSTITLLSYYHRWKTVGIKKCIHDNEVRSLSTGALTNWSLRKADFATHMLSIIESRRSLDPVRTTAILSTIDLFTLFATLRHDTPSHGTLPEDTQRNISSLATTVDEATLTTILETHEKMEKRLARKLHKAIALPLEDATRNGSRAKSNIANGHALTSDPAGEDEDIERPPEDSDDDDSASDAGGATRKKRGADPQAEDSELDDLDEQEEGNDKEAKKQSTLLAEQALCELTAKIVLGVVGQVLPRANDIKARLGANRSKLGKSYARVVAYLDEKKEKKKGGAKRTSITGTGPEKTSEKVGKGKMPLSEAVVVEGDDIEDEDGEEIREEELEREDEADAEEARAREEMGDDEGPEDDIEDVVGD